MLNPFVKAFTDDISNLSNNFGSTMNNFLNNPLTNIKKEIDRYFPVDVSENKDSITIKASLPGIDKKDIQVTTNQNEITITANRKTESEEKNDDNKLYYSRQETHYGSLTRTVQLPINTDPNNPSCQLRDGILTIIFKKLTKPNNILEIT
jgi:HSP20 family protein